MDTVVTENVKRLLEELNIAVKLLNSALEKNDSQQLQSAGALVKAALVQLDVVLSGSSNGLTQQQNIMPTLNAAGADALKSASGLAGALGAKVNDTLSNFNSADAMKSASEAAGALGAKVNGTLSNFNSAEAMKTASEAAGALGGKVNDTLSNFNSAEALKSASGAAGVLGGKVNDTLSNFNSAEALKSASGAAGVLGANMTDKLKAVGNPAEALKAAAISKVLPGPFGNFAKGLMKGGRRKRRFTQGRYKTQKYLLKRKRGRSRSHFSPRLTR